MTKAEAKTYVLYHSCCYDGFGAAYAAWKALKDTAEYIPVSYGNPPPPLDDGSYVFVLDFSYDRETLLKLGERMRRVILLDHHATAKEALNLFETSNFQSAICGTRVEAKFNLQKSGAMLAWEYWHSTTGEIPELIRYIEDRDLRKFVLPESREVHAALESYPMDFYTWDALCGAKDIERLKFEGRIILRYADRLLEKMCDQATIKEIAGYQVPVVNASVLFMEIHEELRRRFPNAPFTAYYRDLGDGFRQWGLGSDGSFDVSAIAKQFGGGGHPDASGFVVAL